MIVCRVKEGIVSALFIPFLSATFRLPLGRTDMIVCTVEERTLSTLFKACHTHREREMPPHSGKILQMHTFQALKISTPSI